MMAYWFIMKLKLGHVAEYPLLSVSDSRIIMIVKIYGNESEFKDGWSKCLSKIRNVKPILTGITEMKLS